MPEFSYRAVDGRGARHQGVLTASDPAAAHAMLSARDLRVVSVTGHRTGGSHGVARSARGKAIDAALLIDELSTLLEASVPLAEAVATLAQPHPPEHPLGQILRTIRGGTSFSQALAGSSLRLPEYALQLVRAGESTGKLGAALRAAASHLEAEQRFTQESRNALLYPMVLIGSGVLATLVMFVFVVPRFASVLDNPKADLPWISQLVLGLGMWLTQHQVVVGAVGALVVGALVWLSGRDEFRRGIWELASRLPVLGPWALHAEMARWASLLAVLLNSRVTLLTALDQAGQTFRRESLRRRSDLVLVDVRGGKVLSQALADHTMLDAAGLNLIRVGERAGSLNQTVASLARMHENQSQQRLKRFLVLLEPLTILLISIVLGGIMISVMLAITSLTNVL